MTHDETPKEEVTRFTCCGSSSRQCKCQCPDGSCEHKWDGEDEVIHYPGGGVSGSVTCSRCGMSAINHDIRVGR